MVQAFEMKVRLPDLISDASIHSKVPSEEWEVGSSSEYDVVGRQVAGVLPAWHGLAKDKYKFAAIKKLGTFSPAAARRVIYRLFLQWWDRL